MRKNYSPFAIIEIGAGVISILMAASGFVLQDVSILTFHILFLGAGLLCYGLSNNSAEKSERGKMLSAAASICLIISAIFGYYHYFYHHHY